MQFTGKVFPRSTARSGGPPGEAAVLALNPQRREAILNATGWHSLESGSLNLSVNHVVPDALLRFTPALVEEGASVKYPPAYAHFPGLRMRYFYFGGICAVRDIRFPVLVRRAEVPPYPGLVELFSQSNLRTSLDLEDGDIVTVEIDEAGREAR